MAELSEEKSTNINESEPHSEIVIQNNEINDGEEDVSSPKGSEIIQKSSKHRKRKLSRRHSSPSSDSSSSSSSSSSSKSDSDSSPKRRKKRDSARSPKRRKKHKRRSNKSRKKKESSPKSSKRFTIKNEEDEYMWDLPEDMMKYAEKHFNTFIPERDLKEAICVENPVPSNICSVKKLDKYLRDILKEKAKQTTLSTDRVFEKIQTKNLEVMGPLTKLWLSIDQAVNSKGDEQQTPITLEDLLQYIEQTVLLIGQTNVSLTYHRRLNVLYSIMNNPAQSKSLLKENAESLQQQRDTDLFGKEFKDHLSENLKARKETKAVLDLTTEKKKWPFPRGPPTQNMRGGGRFQKHKQTWSRKESNGSFTNNFQRKKPGKNTICNQTNLLQHFSRSDSNGKINEGTSSHKKVIFFKRTTSKCSSRRKVKTFFKSMEGNNEGSKHSEYSRRVRNTFYINSMSKDTSQNKNECRRGIINKFGSGGTVEEGSNFKSFPFKGPISKQSFPCGQKRWGEQACHQPKKVKQICAIPAFQDGGLALAQRALEARRLHVQARPERCLSLCPFEPEVKKICTISMVWEFIRVFMPYAFGLGPVPRIFTKLLKIPISILRRINIRIIIYLDDMLLMGSTIEEVLMGRDTLIYLLQNLGFIINQKKSVMIPSQIIEFLGMIINTKEMLLSLPEKKIQKIQNKCQNLLKKQRVSILELTKLIGHLTSTIQAVLPAKLNCRFLQHQQISSLRNQDSYQNKIQLNTNSQKEIMWWINNLKISNGQSLIRKPPQLVI